MVEAVARAGRVAWSSVVGCAGERYVVFFVLGVFELDGWRLTTRSVAGPVRPELIVAEDHRRENQHRDEQQD
jgi:hypothetical protein